MSNKIQWGCNGTKNVEITVHKTPQLRRIKNGVLVSNPMAGLGDLVHKVAVHPITQSIARAVGISTDCIDQKTQELKPDSPCAKRQEALNKLVPFKTSTTQPEQSKE